MTSNDLRKKFLNFFAEKGHTIIPSASLLPEHDPTVLFTTAGMHPLTPFLLGEKHPAGKRLSDVQKCLRTNDIDDIGDNWHLTFFEMLGNWSLGDYWKKEAIEWSFEFLTEEKYLNIPLKKINITVFKGDENALRDEESAKIWQDLGIPKERIFYLPKEDNWWGPAGQTGPCGPCTEMFYDTDKEKCSLNCQPGCKCGKYVEIWNDVFMEYNKTIDGKYEQLKQKNVDTGMGIERTIAILNNFDNVYQTELFTPLIKKIEEFSGKKYSGENIKPMRIISDHLRASVFILAEGLEPSNGEQGYILRRLIRRAIRYGKQLGIKNAFTFIIAKKVIEMYQNTYSELSKNNKFIEEQLIKEEDRFSKTLTAGLREIEKEIKKINEEKIKKSSDELGKLAFYFFETFGFPLELFFEEIKDKFLHNPEEIKESFNYSFQKHKEISRTGSEQKFAGGLSDHSEKVIKYHTTTHLLLASLRQILGPEIYQKGSNITAERLRFDFNYFQKLGEEEIKKIENLVNEKIKENIKIEILELPKMEALKIVKVSFDPLKYGEKVKVYKIGNFSIELCGGPHVEYTGQIGKFKIVKEESSSAGIRRIKAILE